VTYFRALADPVRLEVLALIASRPVPICVCDIVARFELSQPTISHHLKVLREAGLVRSARRGKWAYYSVDPQGAAAARSALDTVFPESVPEVR
jgi:ArsR family transcriptional regulator